MAWKIDLCQHINTGDLSSISLPNLTNCLNRDHRRSESGVGRETIQRVNNAKMERRLAYSFYQSEPLKESILRYCSVVFKMVNKFTIDFKIPIVSINGAGSGKAFRSIRVRDIQGS